MVVAVAGMVVVAVAGMVVAVVGMVVAVVGMGTVVADGEVAVLADRDMVFACAQADQH